MSYAHKLQYSGSKPYQPEIEREDITAEEMELLEQDETYRKLAEVRWLAGELEDDLDDTEGAMLAWREIFDAVAAGDAPVAKAVDEYVAAWLADYRSQEAGR